MMSKKLTENRRQIDCHILPLNSIYFLQILPSLVEMLKEYPGHNLKLCLPCLQFIYWSLVHVEQSQGQQVTSYILQSTLYKVNDK